MPHNTSVIADFPGGMSLEQLRAAYRAEADRCQRVRDGLHEQFEAPRREVLRQQRLSALRRLAALTPARQLELVL